MELVARVRGLLEERSVREVRMFGALAFMVDDAMAVAVRPEGSMLVRVDPDEDAALLQRPHASRAEMGAGRSMGPGWIDVGAEALADDADLRHWVGCATRWLARRGESVAGRPTPVTDPAGWIPGTRPRPAPGG